jgi:hypothetical protein
MKKSIQDLIIVICGYFITVIFIIYFIYNYHFEHFEGKTINLQDLRKQLVANLTLSKGTIMKIPKNLIETDTDACDIKCGADDCIKMKEMKKNLTKCVECHKQKGKCFRNSIIGGNCDDCLEGEVPINCSDTRHYGCAPTHNIQSYDGSLPYFISVPSSELNSAFDKKCIFCWQFSDYI